ncbi:hypothetical protein D3C71_1804460 [compost metagenome]
MCEPQQFTTVASAIDPALFLHPLLERLPGLVLNQIPHQIRDRFFIDYHRQHSIHQLRQTFPVHGYNLGHELGLDLDAIAITAPEIDTHIHLILVRNIHKDGVDPDGWTNLD